MDWARNCFEAEFDFNAKSKICLVNLKWMYNSLHNAKQMLPNEKQKRQTERLVKRTTSSLPKALVVVVESNTNHLPAKCLFA
jgi:hypothetical protein